MEPSSVVSNTVFPDSTQFSLSYPTMNVIGRPGVANPKFNVI